MGEQAHIESTSFDYLRIEAQAVDERFDHVNHFVDSTASFFAYSESTHQ